MKIIPVRQAQWLRKEQRLVLNQTSFLKISPQDHYLLMGPKGSTVLGVGKLMLWRVLVWKKLFWKILCCFFHDFYFRKWDLSALKAFHIYTLEETALEIKFKILEMRVVWNIFCVRTILDLQKNCWGSTKSLHILYLISSLGNLLMQYICYH